MTEHAIKALTEQESIMTQSRLLIDGQLVDTDERLDVINPATGELLTRCARANVGHLEQAVAAAGRAFANWSSGTIATTLRSISTRTSSA